MPRKPVFIGLGCVVAGLVLWGLWQISEEDEMPVRPPFATTEGSLGIVSWTDSTNITSGVAFDLWIRIENRTAKEVLNLAVVRFSLPPEIRRFGPCWRDGAPACRPREQQAGIGIPKLILPNDTVLLHGQLRADEPGNHAGSAYFEWRDSAGPHEEALLLPVVHVAGWRDRAVGFGRILVSGLESFALPVVLALLGWRLQAWDHKRDEEQKRREREEEERRTKLEEEQEERRTRQEKELEIRRADQEKERTQLRETWNLMLPISGRNAEKHYLPLGSEITSFLEAGTEAKADLADDARLRQALFRLLRLLKRMRHLRDEIGGLYFKDRFGERVASICWNRFIGISTKWLVLADKDRALAVLPLDVDFGGFEDVWSGTDPSLARARTALASMKQRVGNWLVDGTFERDLSLLRLLRLVLDYETNRPYKYWYGDSDRPINQTLLKECTRGLTGFDGELDEAMKTYCDSFPSPPEEQRGTAGEPGNEVSREPG